MRLLLINEVCGTGSTGRICTDLAEAFEKESPNNEAKIAYGRFPERVPDNYQKYAVRIGNKADVDLHAIKARLWDAAGFGSKAATKKFLQWVDVYDPNVIHLHNLHGYYINIELLFDYLKGKDKPVIWTLHDCWAFTGHSALCDAAQCEKWVTSCGNCPQKGDYPKSFIDRSRVNWKRKKEIFTGVKRLTVVSPSKWLVQEFSRSFLHDYPAMVVNNGIDTSVFHPDYENKKRVKDEMGVSDKKILLSVASGWTDLKKIDDFIRLSQMIDDQYVIVLVGGMTPATEEKLPDNIIHIPRTENIRQLAEIYNAADVFINLTRCDTYPTVNLEAAACGTPVITYDVGGSTESAIEFGGIAVKRDDLNGIVDAIHRNPKRISPDLNKIDKKNAMQKYVKMYQQ